MNTGGVLVAAASPGSSPRPARFRRILGLALPISAAMVSQSLLNLVDTAMVGTLGDAALGAVSMGGFVVFMGQALLLGISVPVQAMAARRKGEGRAHESAWVLNSALLLIALLAPPLSLLLYHLAPWFYPLLNGDPAVLALAVPYFQIRIVAAMFTSMNYAFRGYWNAIDRPRLYLITLLTMHASNVLLNWVFIFGNLGAPPMGVAGAGLASALSVALGTTIYFSLALRYARGAGFLQRLAPRQENLTLVRLSLPSGLQHLSMMAGMTALFWVVGHLGRSELAAVGVLINITTVAVLPAMGLAFATATLVSQALGANDADGARQWVRDALLIGTPLLGLLGAPMWLAPRWILGGFIHNPETLALAALPLRIVGVSVMLEGFKRVYMHALMGAGDNQRVMRVTLGTQWLLFLPAAYLVGPVLGWGLLAIWLIQELNRLLQTGLFLHFWGQGHWEKLRI